MTLPCHDAIPQNSLSEAKVYCQWYSSLFEPYSDVNFNADVSTAVVSAVKKLAWLFQGYASSRRAASYSRYPLLASSL